MELVGFQLMDFKGNDGGRITGVKLHCLDDNIPAGKGSGRAVYSVFVPSEKCPKIPSVGADVEFFYNRFGRVDRVEILD